MSAERVQRRLAAVLAADVAGYSRLMGADEIGTLSALKAIRREIVDPAVTEHRGRIVKTTGDGMLVEFSSAVDAVACAMTVQAKMIEPRGDTAQSIRLRIGINIGDIIIDSDDIFGDGVNVAARLEGIAEPGGICISSSVYEQVHGKVPVEFCDLGEQTLKNIARPIRAYSAGPGPKVKTDRAAPPPSSAPRLSLVVLPFANIGGDLEQEYFVDGVTESLTTDLSRISGAFVIARNTAFTFKGKAVDVKNLGRELGVRYALEGSLQRSGNRLRVNVQLIDAETGNHLWAERFDKPVADLFDMQDEIVSRLANALETQLTEAEARRAQRFLHPDTLDLIFQGRACWNKGVIPEYMTQARSFFEQALALNPDNVEALVGAALIDACVGASNLTEDRHSRLSAAEAALVKALTLAPQHAPAHATLGLVLISSKRAAQGISECERALALDRNLALAHGFIGNGKYMLGRSAESEGHVNEALRLSPRDVWAGYWMAWVGFAKLQLGADAEAAGWLRRAVEVNRNYPLAHFHLAAAEALIGSIDEARAVAQAGLALNPGFTIRRLRMNALSENSIYLAGREHIYEGMRLAGVPEE